MFCILIFLLKKRVSGFTGMALGCRKVLFLPPPGAKLSQRFGCRAARSGFQAKRFSNESLAKSFRSAEIFFPFLFRSREGPYAAGK
jgi:hypothetical protein